MTFGFERPTELMLGDLQAVISAEARNAKRSRQRAIGPSELGQACERKLALTLLGTEAINDNREDWTATVGTALHSWMEMAFRNANARLAESGLPARWLVETEIDIRTGLTGHVDVYDLWTHTVLDHKFPGVSSIRKYRKQGHPGQQYRWQGHLYGYGWAQLGLPVREIAICMYPRSGLIRDSWLWKEPYSEAIATEGLNRLDGLLTGMDIAEGMGELPAFMQTLARDTEHCETWCPFFSRGHADPTTGCQGPFEDPGYQPDSDGILR